MDVTMAVVQRLGMKWGGGCGGGARWRCCRWGVLLFATSIVLTDVPTARAADDVQWVAPAMLDEVPVRSAPDASPEPAAPVPIVVPLPPALAPGAVGLAAMAASQWWTRRRRP